MTATYSLLEVDGDLLVAGRIRPNVQRDLPAAVRTTVGTYETEALSHDVGLYKAQLRDGFFHLADIAPTIVPDLAAVAHLGSYWSTIAMQTHICGGDTGGHQSAHLVFLNAGTAEIVDVLRPVAASCLRLKLALDDQLPMATGAGWPEVLTALSQAARSAKMSRELTARAWEAGHHLGTRGVMLLPEIGDANDGDLSFIWKQSSGEASLTFEEDGTVLGYGYRYGDDAAWNLETQVFNINRLAPLIELLNRF